MLGATITYGTWFWWIGGITRGLARRGRAAVPGRPDERERRGPRFGRRRGAAPGIGRRWLTSARSARPSAISPWWTTMSTRRWAATCPGRRSRSRSPSRTARRRRAPRVRLPARLRHPPLVRARARPGAVRPGRGLPGPARRAGPGRGEPAAAARGRCRRVPDRHRLPERRGAEPGGTGGGQRHARPGRSSGWRQLAERVAAGDGTRGRVRRALPRPRWQRTTRRASASSASPPTGYGLDFEAAEPTAAEGAGAAGRWLLPDRAGRRPDRPGRRPGADPPADLGRRATGPAAAVPRRLRRPRRATCAASTRCCCAASC